MKQFLILSVFLLIVSANAGAQSFKLGYFSKIPTPIKNCGARYSYDSVSLQKKKFILLTDFQNLGLIIINGRQISLQLKDAKTKDKTNISTYNGGGYTIILSSITTGQKNKTDLETGSIEISKGSAKQTIRVHGQSYCNESTGEQQ